jgi:3-oxoacyl-[acyl-carrier protein] reductase
MSAPSSSTPVALVTGGSRGIGYAIAEHLAKAGYDVVITGRRPASDVSDVIKSLEATGRRVWYYASDVGSASDREALLASIEKEAGGLNLLVNNAGVAPKERKDILEASAESFEYVIKVNLEGPYFLTQLAANWMIRQKAANPAGFYSIVTISSISASVASVNRGEYCVAKAGLSMMTRLFATRLGEYDIPVYEIQPGVTKTDMTSGVSDKYDKLIADGLCLTRRWGFPEDIAKAVASIARGDFPYSTGQVFMVDGGLTMPRL